MLAKANDSFDETLQTYVCEPVAKSLNSGRDGYNDGSDQTYVCLPQVAGCIQERDAKGADSDTKPGHLLVFNERVITSPGNRSSVNGDKSPTLNGGKGMTIAFPQNLSGTQCAASEEIAPVLQSRNPTAVAFQPHGRGQPTEIVPALNGSDAGATSDMRPCIATRSSVRRLTPLECTRLQGFSDYWLDGLGFSDSTKYRMLGNAVAVPVVEWIARRMKNARPAL